MAGGGLSRLAADRLRKARIELEPLLSRAGLTVQQIDDPEHRINARSQIAFLELAADALHRRTGGERFAAAAARWWDEIDRYFLDRQHGGWWQELAPDMTPATSTWSGKPDLYHCYQALLLPSLPLSPTAATALARR